ncbi:MAG: alpha/beta fold hydrolase [Chthoniobacterales bacterium]
MPFVNVSGYKMYYSLDGGLNLNDPRPVLVLSHSLGLDHGQWTVQVPDLLPHFQVLRYDLRGHGASDASPGDYTMDGLASDVLAIVDALQVGQFAYCGQSIGAMIGQSVAATAPDRVTKLVLANTTCRGYPEHMRMRQAKVLNEGIASIQEMVMHRYFSADTLAANHPATAWARYVHLHNNPVGYAGCCAAIATLDQEHLLPLIRARTLVLGGEWDTATPWQTGGAVIARAIAGAQAAVLPASHISNIDRPQAFITALLEFLL